MGGALGVHGGARSGECCNHKSEADSEHQVDRANLLQQVCGQGYDEGEDGTHREHERLD
jgi:hypothetical protein